MMPVFSLIVQGNPKDLANKISSLIFDRREWKNLYRSKIEQRGQNEFIVSYWSDQGIFHDCWIDAIIKRINDTHCIVSFETCNCSEMTELVKIVAKNLES